MEGNVCFFLFDANFDEDFFLSFFWTTGYPLYDKAFQMLAKENMLCVCVRILINVASSFWEAQLLVCRCLAKSCVLEGII